MEEKKSNNNNNENERKNEVKQRITETRPEIIMAIFGYRREGVESVQHYEGNTNQQTLVQPQLAMAMLKVHFPCLCDGCAKKIRKVVTKTIGYHPMTIDRTNGQVTVKGSITDMNALAKTLKRQLKKYAEIVPFSPQR